MRTIGILLLMIVLSLIVSCQRQNTVCPENSITYAADLSSLIAASESSAVEAKPALELVEIKGKVMKVDQVVHGPLCNAQWAGTVYVACDIQIAAWTESPLFLKECAFSVEPGSTVYVAAHNDTAYYKGCSCHTGELAAQ